MVNKKQIDALQSILETANEKFNNGLDLIHKDFERYGHFMYETTFKNMFKANVIKHIIELSEDEKFNLEKWSNDMLKGFKTYPFLVSHSTNEISNMESIWKNEVRLDICHILDRISKL